MPAPYDSGLHARIADLNCRRLPRHSPQDAMIRDLVSQRATDACEYCLMPTHGKFEVEHIVPEARWLEYLAKQYPGLRPAERLNLPDHDHINNFAWSCFFCNRAKSGQKRSYKSTRLFDPRYDHWPKHFRFSRTKGCGVVLPLTTIGAHTIRTLKFHEGGPEGPLAERYAVTLDGKYPPTWLRKAYGI